MPHPLARGWGIFCCAVRGSSSGLQCHFKHEHVGNANRADSLDFVVAQIRISLEQLARALEHSHADTDRCPLGKHLIVSITGWTNDLCDGTTKLSPGAGMHRFVKKESYVFYRKARVEDAAVLSKGVADGIFVQHDPIGDVLLAQILAGICASKQTPRKVKKYAGCD
jgi:hypothetical protein